MVDLSILLVYVEVGLQLIVAKQLQIYQAPLEPRHVGQKVFVLSLEPLVVDVIVYEGSTQVLLSPFDCF